jgi:DNA-binding NarL/FixJ family response regulator
MGPGHGNDEHQAAVFAADGQPVAVFVADDHPAFLATLGRVIDAAPGFELAGTAGSGAEALVALADLDHVDLVLVDVVMDNMTGIEFDRRYRAVGGRGTVVLMSSYEAADLPSTVGADGAGAGARFIPKAELHPDGLTRLWRRISGTDHS